MPADQRLQRTRAARSPLSRQPFGRPRIGIQNQARLAEADKGAQVTTQVEIIATNRAAMSVDPYSQATRAGGFIFGAGQAAPTRKNLFLWPALHLTCPLR